MHHSAAICSNDLEMLVAERQAVTAAAAADSNQTSSHGCVQPLVVGAGPVILVSGREVVCESVAAVGSVVIALPVNVDCSAKLVTSQNDSQSHTRHKRKRRRKNKVSCEPSESVSGNLW